MAFVVRRFLCAVVFFRAIFIGLPRVIASAPRCSRHAGEATTVPGSPVRFSRNSTRADALPPELGQHTEEVLLEAGYSWEEIVRLSESGAI